MNLPFNYNPFLLAVIVFLCSLGLWFRQSLFGYDGYATLACVRFDWCSTLSWQEIPVMFFKLLPDSMLVFKLLMFVSLFLSVYVLWRIALLYFDERRAWLSVFVLFAVCPFLLFEFSKFENELFAFPLILLGLFWLLDKKKYFFVAWLASLVFWLWPGYFFIGFNSVFLESQLFGSLQLFFVSVFFIPLVFFVRDKFLWLVCLFCIGVGLFSTHLAVFLLVPVVLGVAQTVKMLDKTRFSVNSLFIGIVFLIVALNVALFLSVPSVYELDLVDKTIKISEDENLEIKNDWSYGYWFWSKEKMVKNHPGNAWVTDFNGEDFVALTSQDLGLELGCERVDGFGSLARNINLWRC